MYCIHAIEGHHLIFEEAPQPFAPPHWTCMRGVLADRRKEQDIPFPLMISLGMIMRYVFCEGTAERALPKQDEPREAFLLDRAHPPFRGGVEMGRPRRQRHPRAPRRVNNVLKGRAVFSVPVMDQVLPGRQDTPPLHGDVAGDLHHPLGIGMWRHTRDMDLST